MIDPRFTRGGKLTLKERLMQIKPVTWTYITVAILFVALLGFAIVVSPGSDADEGRDVPPTTSTTPSPTATTPPGDGPPPTTTATTTTTTSTPPPGNPLPNAPSSPTPADSAEEQAWTVTLKWNGGDPDGTSPTYKVLFGTSEEPSETICDWNSKKECEKSGLSASTWYYWQVIAKDSKSPYAQVEGPVWKLKTGDEPNQDPNEPGNPSPSDGATGRPYESLTLSWQGGDPDGDDVTYTVHYGTSSPPTGEACVDTSSTSCTLSGLDPDTTYYWRVTAKDEHGASKAGAVWSFATQTSEPDGFDPCEELPVGCGGDPQ